jgi:hypothetical protein
MKTEEIKQLFEEFESAATDIEGVECWSAREIQLLLGYSKWENFEKVIQKAKDACTNAGEQVANHFPDIRKTIPMPKGAEKEILDIALTRYACYLVAQNGDSRKQEISFAQNYFAVQTRRAEIIEQRLLEYERIKAREKLSHTEKQLSGILFERGVDNQGFAVIRSKGVKSITDAITWKNEDSERVIKKTEKDGTILYEADSDLQDTENVPLDQDIHEYFEREVLLHIPDAWIDESKTVKGYEISFTRYFYNYVPPRSIEEITAEIFQLEKETEGILNEIVND